MSARHVTSTKAQTKPEADNAGTGWQFVNITGCEQTKDAELRKFVRTNAMLHYRRNVNQSSKPPSKTKAKPRTQRKGHPTVPSDAALSLAPLEDARSLHASEQQPYGWWQLPIRPGIGCNVTNPSLPSKTSSRLVSEIDHSAFGLQRSEFVVSEFRTSASPSELLNCNGDPFDSYPIKGGPTTGNLLNHCEFSSVSFTPWVYPGAVQIPAVF